MKSVPKFALAFAFALVFLVLIPNACADEYAYEVNSLGQFGFIDLTTGVFTPLGTMSVTLGGIGIYQGNIYGYELGTGTLYQVNSATGAVTQIGTTTFVYRGMGSTSAGLWGFDQNMALYSVDPTNGSTTLIGSTGLRNPSGFGVADGLTTLYVTPTFNAGCSGTWLYSVNTSTAAVRRIGKTGVCGIGAMAVEDGTLYAGVFSPTAVYTVNEKTGAATLVADISGTSGYFYGLAPAAQVAP